MHAIAVDQARASLLLAVDGDVALPLDLLEHEVATIEDDLRVILTDSQTKVTTLRNRVRFAIKQRGLSVPEANIHIIADPPNKHVSIRIDYDRTLLGIALHYQANREASSFNLPIEQLAQAADGDLELIGNSKEDVNRYRQEQAVKSASEKLKSYQGDPASALLEVLDPEQNQAFVDHYLDVPFDLSRVLFIATANSLDTIPAPLLDRMETISLSGYTTLEKRHIARQHLVPKQIRTNGLREGEVQLSDEVIDKIITSYTRESGVRNLEREIGSVCRAKAVEYAETKESEHPERYRPQVSVEDLEGILGIEKFDEEITEKQKAKAKWTIA